MTLSSTATKVSYDGDGSTTEFAINFVFWDADDLRVVHRASDGTETVWARGTHYTVTGGSGAGGTLTVKTAPTDFTPAAGESLVIKDSQAETQSDSLPLSGAFPSTVVEQRFDRLTRLIQIHSEEIARSILLPETASVSGLTIPEPGAGELLRYNPTGSALETVKAGDLELGVDTLLTGLATDDLLRWDEAQAAWVNISPGATGVALLQDGTAPAARATLQLGTAAIANVGTSGANLPQMNARNTWSKGQIGAPVALVEAATIPIDFADGNNFAVTLTADRVLGNPANQSAGQSGVIVIKQDATGGWALTFDTEWLLPNGVLTPVATAPNAINTLSYYVESDGVILGALSTAFATPA